MFKLTLFAALALLCTVSANPVIEKTIFDKLQTQKVNVIIYMKETTTTFVERFRSTTFANRSERLKTVVGALKSFTSQSQRPVLDFLEAQKPLHDFKYRPLFATNAILLENADYSTISRLLEFETIGEILEEREITIESFEETPVQSPKAGESWGVLQVHAPEVWALGNRGEGAVVGLVSTGVRYTHEALRSNWREEYGWYDPSAGSATPNDGNGAGTHSMGVAVGASNGVGVAPGASWIACKGCSTSSCSTFALLACGDWIACPTLSTGDAPDCSKAPHIVVNPWGGGLGDGFYGDVIASWRAVNILPIFPASGSNCGGIASPADNLDVFATGAVDSNDAVTANSGRGPVGSAIKPDAVGPAVNIVSSYYLSDTSYSTLSSTTVASSSAAGVFALVRSAAGADSDISVDQLIAAVHSGCDPVSSAGDKDCGGIPESQYPNNGAGYGRLNALRSVQSLRGV